MAHNSVTLSERKDRARVYPTPLHTHTIGCALRAVVQMCERRHAPVTFRHAVLLSAGKLILSERAYPLDEVRLW